MDKEESFLKNRFSDLANSSYNRNIYTYTDFLNLNEISILNSYKNCSIFTWGYLLYSGFTNKAYRNCTN